MAAALGKQIREELSCSICLELFTRPKVLPCQHTFCQDCLQDHAGRGGTFQCPNCRLQVSLPPQGVAGLPDNHLVTSLCATLQQKATLSEETSGLPQEAGSRCNFHPSEKLKLYCKPCHLSICELCLEAAHDDHRTTTIKKAAQEMRSTVQALINEGRNILESYCGFIRGLAEEEKTLNEQIQHTKNNIIQAYNQMVQKLTERKDQLLSEAEQNKGKNLERIENGRDIVLADVSELSAVCDRAEQEMEQGGLGLLSQETALAEVVGKYRGKAAPTPVQTQPAVFQPTDTPVPVLGHVTVQPLRSAPIPAAPAARGKGHHQGNQEQVAPISSVAPTSDAADEIGATGVTGCHHGNQRQGRHRLQKVTFGGKGSGTGQFNSPSGVTVSDDGEIFVVDAANRRIQVFTLQGTFVRQFPTVVSRGQEMKPQDVALDGEGNLWVVGEKCFAFSVQYDKQGMVVGGTDSADHDFAVKYDKQGRVLRKFDLQKTKCQFDRGVAVDTRRNRILITQTTGDWLNIHGEVLVFEPDGTLVRTVGQLQGMKNPVYMTVDGEGRILVSDCGNHCVYVYSEDGQFLFKFGGKGSGEGQLYNPHGICTDGAANIIVADSGNSRVEMFDKTGRFLKHIGTDMKAPQTVAMATQGQLVVTFWNHTVSILENF
ncbi:tripartite motif-containing protein 3-like [Branchiostoma lanceolatum]|uniref:tripartite motif-containing protein 3-like n=1 Tax=Branchiostoma lanceolatum TaxID=7740 RepID=UPI003456A15C